MGRKLLIIFLLLIIAFVVRFLYISQTRKTWVSDLCSLSLAAGQSKTDFRRAFLSCSAKYYWQLSWRSLDCQNLPLPSCEIDENTERLCQLRADKGQIKTDELATCQLDNVCPEDLSLYQALKKQCR